MEVIKNKLINTFENCQEKRNNLVKVAETLKKYFFEIKDHQESRDVFINEFLFYVECVLQESSRELSIERCVKFVAVFSALFADTSDEEDNIQSPFSDEENIFNFVISLITKAEIHCHSNKTIRFRVCQLVQLLLSSVPQNAALDEDLMDCLTKVMLDRMQDKIPMVRAQAAYSLSRLQQPTLPNCPVIAAYQFHMSCDDSAHVRASVLANLSLITKTLPNVLDRTRDISENVRKTAFQVISQKVSIKALTSTQRLYLIKQGLLDQSEMVQEVVKKQLFQAWLLTYEANLLDLLKKLDVVGAYDTCRKAVIAMFECSPLHDLIEGFTLLNEKKLINFSDLTPESSIYWCLLCDFMKTNGVDRDRYLDGLLPDLFLFSNYLNDYFDEVLVPFIAKIKTGLSPEEEDEKIEKEFVAEQLIKIAIGMDLSDNAGRKKLHEVLENGILALDIICFPCLTAPLASALLHLLSTNGPLVSEENEKVSLFASLITSIREPYRVDLTVAQDKVILNEGKILEIKHELAKISVYLNEANEKLKSFVDQKDFAMAAETQALIDDANQKKEGLKEKLSPVAEDQEIISTSTSEKTDVGTMVKCLILVKEILSSIFERRCASSRKKEASGFGIPSTMLQLVDTLVVPSVLNGSSLIRKQAIRCLGVSCMFSFTLAARHFSLLMQVAQADDFEVRAAAINAVNDLIRMFGVSVFTSFKRKTSSKEEEDVDLNSLGSPIEDVDLSQSIMDIFVEMLEDKEVEIRYAATSLLASVMISHRIISPSVVSRLILLWYDPTTQDEPSILNIVSSFLDIFPYISKEAHECIKVSFLPVLRVLFNAPPTSPFASVNISNVAELIVSITNPDIIRKADLKPLGINQDKKWLNDWSAHDDFAVMISNEVLSDPNSPYVNTLCKILQLLHLNPAQAENIRDLQVLVTNLLKEVNDKQAVRHIRKFQSHVSSLYKICKLSNLENIPPDSNGNVCNSKPSDQVSNSSVLQTVDENTATPKTLQISQKFGLQQETVVLTNPKRNLSTALLNSLD